MQFRLTELMLSLALSGLLFGNCGNDSNKIVARVDGIQIKLSEFEKTFSGKTTESKDEEITYEDKLAHLNTLIDRSLKILAAQQLDIDKEDEIKKQLSEEEKRLAYNQLMEEEIVNKNIPEAEIKEGYNLGRDNLKMRQIFIALPDSAPGLQVDSVKNKMKKLRIDILRGADFAELAKIESMDEQSAKNGGLIESVNWLNARTDKELVKRAVKLPLNKVSKPIRTSRGFYLVKVEEKQKQEQDNYEMSKERIKNSLMRQRMQELTKKYETFKENVLAAYNPRINHNNVELLTTWLQDSLTEIKNRGNNGWNQFDGLTDREKEIPLVEFVGGRITVTNAIDALHRVYDPRRPLPSFGDQKRVLDYLNIIIPQEIFIAEAFKKRMNQSGTVISQLKDVREKLLLTKIEKLEVTDKVAPTEDDYRNYYENNKVKYQHEPTYLVQEIFLSDQDQARQLARRAKSGENFDKLADRYTTRKNFKDQHGVMGYITKNQYSPIGKTAAEMQIGEISDPVRLGQNWSVIKLLDKKQDVIKSYEEAKGQVMPEAREKMLQERRETWKKELRENNRVVIYEKVLMNALREKE